MEGSTREQSSLVLAVEKTLTDRLEEVKRLGSTAVILQLTYGVEN